MLMPTNQWPESPTAQNIRLFAQLVSHKADIGTFEAFRAMSLDTVSRIREAIEVLDGVEAGRPVESFKPVKDELIWSMEQDPVLDHDEFSAVKKFIHHFRSDERGHHSYTKSRLSVLDGLVAPDYKKRLENMILASITSLPPNRLSTEQKIEFRIANDRRLAALSSIYVTHLTSIGYSRSYILYVANRFFFANDVTRVRISKVRSFFDQFDASVSNFRVFLCVTEQARKYFLGASGAEQMDRSSIPDQCLSAIDLVHAKYPETPHVITIRQKAVDIFTAGQKAFSQIRSYQASAFLGAWVLDLGVTEEIIVATRGFGSHETFKVGHGDIAAARKIDIGSDRAVDRSIEEARSLFDKVNNDVDRESADRIINALSTAYSAASSQNAESQLISLWSAYEALLSAPPPSSSSRIVHYNRLILPTICSHYPTKNCIYVSNVLVRFSLDEYNKLVNSLNDKGVSYPERYSYLVVALSVPEYQNFYDDLIYSNNNRLIVNLLVSLKERFSNPSLFYDSIERHERKASWQISRMYRARNQIVHAGVAPNFADSVAVNAFEYMATMMGTLSSYLSKERGLTSIDHAVELIAMNYYSAKEDVKRLKGPNVFDKLNYHKAFRSVV